MGVIKIILLVLAGLMTMDIIVGGSIVIGSLAIIFLFVLYSFVVLLMGIVAGLGYIIKLLNDIGLAILKDLGWDD